MSNDPVDIALDVSKVMGFNEGTGGNPEPMLIAAIVTNPAVAGQSEQDQYGVPIDDLEGIGIYRTVTGNNTTAYGFKWQCVEFVNRYYARKKGIENMSGHGRSYIDRTVYGMITSRSGVATEPPQYGDILVTTQSATRCGNAPCGHVAIAGKIIVIDEHTISVEVKQQNHSPSTFPTQFRRNNEGFWSGGEFSNGYPIEAWVGKRG
jgi:hypothetical protein